MNPSSFKLLTITKNIALKLYEKIRKEVFVMNGETPLIIKDLNLGLSVKEISLKYKKSECNIRAIAKRHNIVIKRVKQSEKDKERLDDRERYNSKERMRPDIAMPELPFRAAKFGSFGKLTGAWPLKEGSRKGKKNDVAAQIKYGLHTRLIGQ